MNMKIAQANVKDGVISVLGPRNRLLFQLTIRQEKDHGIAKVTDHLVQVREGRLLTTFDWLGRVIERRIEKEKPTNSSSLSVGSVPTRSHSRLMLQAA